MSSSLGSFTVSSAEWNAADAFAAAAAYADWKNAPGFYQILTDQPGKTSWPITGASFILIPAKSDKPASTAEVMKFFDWAFNEGDKAAEVTPFGAATVLSNDEVAQLLSYLRSSWGNTATPVSALDSERDAR